MRLMITGETTIGKLGVHQTECGWQRRFIPIPHPEASEEAS